MRRYESVVILDPELANDEIVGFTERYSQVIRSNGGEIIKIE
ncbi:MAG: 30S ribosomal protein S6, partial [Deltaproteobacteria bacterium]|nr:30S ribosomal protein S6 [Deltaproteobacteria bacterium]